MGFIDELRHKTAKRLHPETDDATMELLDRYDRLRSALTLSVSEAVLIEQARAYHQAYDAHENWFPVSADQARTLIDICERVLAANIDGDL